MLYVIAIQRFIGGGGGGGRGGTPLGNVTTTSFFKDEKHLKSAPL